MNIIKLKILQWIQWNVMEQLQVSDKNRSVLDESYTILLTIMPSVKANTYFISFLFSWSVFFSGDTKG